MSRPKHKGREYTTATGLWRYRVGRKGLNLVKAYEREKGGALHVEVWVPGPDAIREKRRHVLANSKGERVYDRDIAMDIADHMSERQWQAAHATTVEEILGRPVPRTLGELVAELHRTRQADWTPKHRSDQERLRGLWLATLGEDRRLATIHDALAVQKARDVAAANEWSPRRHARFLGYLREAFAFAALELKWLEPRAMLTGAKGPRVRPKKDRHYTVDEVRSLVKAATKADPRVAAALAIACMTGRRLGAIRTLPASAYRREGVAGVIEFPAETDKARTEGRAILTSPLRECVDRLVRTPAVRASGKLFPAGDLDDRASVRPYAADTWLTDRLHELERAAEVPYVEGRAWHGFKKFFATVVEPTLAADQSGTDEATLRRHYRSADDARRHAAAGQVAAALAGGRV